MSVYPPVGTPRTIAVKGNSARPAWFVDGILEQVKD